MYIADSYSFDKLLSAVMHLNKINASVAYVNPNSEVDTKVLTILQKRLLTTPGTKVIMYYKSNTLLNNINQTQFLSIADSI